jgi:hypothetical protein
VHVDRASVARDHGAPPPTTWRIDARYPRYAGAPSDSEEPLPASGHSTSEPGGVLLNPELSLLGVFPDVWSFRLGGYDVLPRWLRQRRLRDLGEQDWQALLSLVEVIRRTTLLRAEIDRAMG